jgi:hypothetical protein
MDPQNLSLAAVPNDDGSASSTLRNRRRRARLRAAGIAPASYELPRHVVVAVEQAAANMNLTPSEYLTRLVSSELVRVGALVSQAAVLQVPGSLPLSGVSAPPSGVKETA